LAIASLAGPAAAQAGGYGAPDGWYPYAVSITKASQNPIVLDGRSPDTRDASQAAQASSPDGWYPYAVSITKASQNPIVLDGRSPDTVDFAVQAHSPLVSITGTRGFHWGDFGIGGAAALGAMLLLLLSMRSLATRQGRKQPPVATT
jgi:hypothetical protein